MGIIHTEIELTNAGRDDLAPMTVNALVDSGAVHLVLGDRALLGAIPMEDMDLVVSPSRQTATVNPANPNIAASLAMGLRTSHP